MSLFSKELEKQQQPLADKLRPKTLEEIIGQSHLIHEEKPLYQVIKSGNPPSMIFWGPPGVGKTTLGRVTAKYSGAEMYEISAVAAGVKDIKERIDWAKRNLDVGKPTILFIDEIHRFNKAQQDVILPHVENGLVKLIGSTTENPSFYVNPALRSRCHIYELYPIPFDELKTYIENVIEKEIIPENKDFTLTEEILANIIHAANGDVRSMLNNLELVSSFSKSTGREINEEALKGLLQQASILYDKDGNEHYDHASAFQKSLRGSDPNAAIYYLGKMIAGGEDPRFISRRLMITAAEDVGNADPMAFVLAKSVAESVEKIGFPEARIPLAQAVLYVANAPKSNSSICAIDHALSDIQSNGKNFKVPFHLRDTHYKEAKEIHGYGDGYTYSHAEPEKEQLFLPDELIGTNYYTPKHQNEKRFEATVDDELLDKVMEILEEEFQQEKEVNSSEIAEKLQVSQTKIVSALFYLEKNKRVAIRQKHFLKILGND